MFAYLAFRNARLHGSTMVSPNYRTSHLSVRALLNLRSVYAHNLVRNRSIGAIVRFTIPYSVVTKLVAHLDSFRGSAKPRLISR